MSDAAATQALGRLPHAGHMRLIAGVAARPSADRLLAWWDVPAQGPHTDGHFPGRPVVPGVLLIEALAQAAAVLWLMDAAPDDTRLPLLAGVDKARFKRPVRPGDRVDLEVHKVSDRRGFWKLEATARVGAQVVATAHLLATAR